MSQAVRRFKEVKKNAVRITSTDAKSRAAEFKRSAQPLLSILEKWTTLKTEVYGLNFLLSVHP